MRSTAIATLVAASLAGSAALAQDDQAQQPQDQSSSSQQAPYITAEMMQEARIVSLEGEYDSAAWENDEPLQPIIAGLDEIGGVEDILLDDQGRIQGITTDIGGFLGIAQKTVMIPLSDIRLARSPEGEEITIVTRQDREQLERAPAHERPD